MSWHAEIGGSWIYVTPNVPRGQAWPTEAAIEYLTAEEKAVLKAAQRKGWRGSVGRRYTPSWHRKAAPWDG